MNCGIFMQQNNIQNENKLSTTDNEINNPNIKLSKISHTKENAELLYKLQ